MAERTAAEWHDEVNIWVLCLVFILAVLSLMHGMYSPGHMVVIVVMTTYLLFDMTWIALVPAIAKTPVSVILHHIVTLVVICGGIEHAKHRVLASMALLVEINTVLITLRRKLGRPLWCEVGFFATWIGLRLIWFPMLSVAMLASTFGYAEEYAARTPSFFYVPIDTPPAICGYASISFTAVVVLQFYWTFALAGSTLNGAPQKSDARAKKTDGHADNGKDKDKRIKSLLLPTALLLLPTLALLASAVKHAMTE